MKRLNIALGQNWFQPVLDNLHVFYQAITKSALNLLSPHYGAAFLFYLYIFFLFVCTIMFSKAIFYITTASRL